MSSHSRTMSESSYEFVKTDEQVLETPTKKPEEENKSQETPDVLSFNGDIHSEIESSDEEENASGEMFSECEEETVIENETTDESEKTETVSLQVSEPVKESVEGSSELCVGVENDEKPVDVVSEKSKESEKTPENNEAVSELVENSESKDPHSVQEKEFKNEEDVPKEVKEQEKISTEKPVEETKPVPKEEVLQNDPLGALETSASVQNTKKEGEKSDLDPSTASIMLSEINYLRYEVEKLKRVQAGQKEKILQFQKNFDRQRELEKERDDKINPPILTSICGEWRLTNMEDYDYDMKIDGIAFPYRWRTIAAHTVYEFDGFHVTSYNKLCCKHFNHSSLKIGYDFSPARGPCSRTFVRDKILVTVWKNPNGGNEKIERFIGDGLLHVVHTTVSQKITRIYERVNGKRDALYSLGNASKVYLKFW
uniref:DUF3444 domain-containing protein n=1 Tax=Caenorhabditis tropicalis TaxID=1561998 RepID=A0A1I7TST0_9PELO